MIQEILTEVWTILKSSTYGEIYELIILGTSPLGSAVFRDHRETQHFQGALHSGVSYEGAHRTSDLPTYERKSSKGVLEGNLRNLVHAYSCAEVVCKRTRQPNPSMILP